MTLADLRTTSFPGRLRVMPIGGISSNVKTLLTNLKLIPILDTTFILILCSMVAPLVYVREEVLGIKLTSEESSKLAALCFSGGRLFGTFLKRNTEIRSIK